MRNGDVVQWLHRVGAHTHNRPHGGSRDEGQPTTHVERPQGGPGPGSGGRPGRAPLPRGDREQPAQTRSQAQPGVRAQAPRRGGRQVGVGRRRWPAFTSSRRRPTSGRAGPHRRQPATSTPWRAPSSKVAGLRRAQGHRLQRLACRRGRVPPSCSAPTSAGRQVTAPTQEQGVIRPPGGSAGRRPPRGTRAGPCRRSTPVMASQARSGWGMSPTTFPSSLHTPAMSASDRWGCRGSAGRCGPRPASAPAWRRRRCSSPRSG